MKTPGIIILTEEPKPKEQVSYFGLPLAILLLIAVAVLIVLIGAIVGLSIFCCRKRKKQNRETKPNQDYAGGAWSGFK